MVRARRALGLLLLPTLLGAVLAHYNLKDPAPYNPIDCNQPSCMGPCPPIWTHGPSRALTSPSNPATTWARGQRVRVEWHRNNHEGGYYRRALVPVSRMDDPWWHKRLAFEWGCFAQGRFRCGFAKSCGSDMGGLAYRNAMTVPDVFPDGDYVFAMVWFGGIHWRRHRAFFSDYHTCAFVRIRGGAPLRAKFEPRFVPGTNNRPSMPRGVCASTSRYVAECGGKPCHGNRVEEDIAGAFRWGNKPRAVYASDVLHAQRKRGYMPPQKHDDDVARRMRAQEAKEGRMDRHMANIASLDAQRKQQQQNRRKGRPIGRPRPKPQVKRPQKPHVRRRQKPPVRHRPNAPAKHRPKPRARHQPKRQNKNRWRPKPKSRKPKNRARSHPRKQHKPRHRPKPHPRRHPRSKPKHRPGPHKPHNPGWRHPRKVFILPTAPRKPRPTFSLPTAPKSHPRKELILPTAPRKPRPAFSLPTAPKSHPTKHKPRSGFFLPTAPSSHDPHGPKRRPHGHNQKAHANHDRWCAGAVPRKVTGSYGRRYSMHYRWQMIAARKRYLFCKDCPHRC